MTEADMPDPGKMPSAVIREKKEFSLIWVVPIVAVMIAAGLVYKAVSEKGPVVTITFESASGLEAGKTKIRYKDVDIGEVATINVSEDLTGVVITANLGKEATRYLTEKTRFWVVKPRVSGGSVSGLDTLFSGSYIAIDPGTEGDPQLEFKGLEVPPVVLSGKPGRHFRLRTSKMGSLESGSPVYFQGIKVGQVVGYELAEDEDIVDIRVFIESPHDRRVFETTCFWFSSGVDVDLDADGMRINTPSFVSFLIGGLVFANPENQHKGEAAGADALFQLFDSYEEAMAKTYIRKNYYILKFDQSVRGLDVGAPVEFRGFVIGEVVDISIEANWDTGKVIMPVKIAIEPERTAKLIDEEKVPEDIMEVLVKMGLRAQLNIGSIISGKLFVALDFFPHADPVTSQKTAGLPEIPTIPSSMDQLSRNLNAFLNKIEKLPLNEIGDAALNTIKSIERTSDSVNNIVSSDEIASAVTNLNASLRDIQNLVAQLEKELPDAVTQVSGKTMDTLDGIQKTAAPDSAVMFELRRTLKEFTKAAQSIRALADHLERHPESLLQGKGKNE